jgi:hypothetical protein
MREKCNKQIPVKIGYQGYQSNHVSRTIYLSESSGLWFYSGLGSAIKGDGNRYWNAFGLSDLAPRQNSMLSIVCEINPPIKGLDKRPQGVFFRDGEHLWMLHRGRINRSKPGVGRKFFFDNYQGKTRIIDGDNFAVVGDVNSSDFVDKVLEFVREVKRIKSLT